ncbi:MAG TPA: ribosomal protein S18-alanine N-acetyltransferase [Sunxiuqinia sp.]|nr:ribosomal protein S18-alanine N-acetyltransferase [Sunxiuqinia sp.]
MEASKVTIRLAEKTDVKALFKIEQRSFDAESFSRRQINYLATRSSGFFWVLAEASEIAGFIVLLQRKNTRGLRIYSLAVSPNFRGKSYGRLLLEKALQTANENAKQYLYLEVSEENQSAIRLYQKFGFQITGKRKAYYKDGSAALLMQLPFVNYQ